MNVTRLILLDNGDGPDASLSASLCRHEQPVQNESYDAMNNSISTFYILYFFDIYYYLLLSYYFDPYEFVVTSFLRSMPPGVDDGGAIVSRLRDHHSSLIGLHLSSDMIFRTINSIHFFYNHNSNLIC